MYVVYNRTPLSVSNTHIGTTHSAPTLRLAPLRALCTLSPRAALQHLLTDTQTQKQRSMYRNKIAHTHLHPLILPNLRCFHWILESMSDLRTGVVFMQERVRKLLPARIRLKDGVSLSSILLPRLRLGV